MTTALPLIDEQTQTKSRVLGCLEVQCQNKKLKLPLKGVEIVAKVADRLAHVTMTETFQNPHNEHLEAVYIFPLSGGCAVSSFKMKVGDRIIEGAVNERQKARAEYAEAIQDGKRAALLEQERDDVFTVQVGNLPPGEEITVILTYCEKLAYFENGTTEIRLPLVVSERYIPGAPVERDNVGGGVESDTDQVPDASRISPPRLAQGVDPKVALKLSVVLAGGQMVEDLTCSQHATKLGAAKDGITVSLSQETELLNRDFVLRWRLAGDETRSNFLVFPSAKNKSLSYAMLSLIPPRAIDIASAPRDVIFVLDRSGSMQGIKMVSAARACAYLLSTLGPNDRFAIQAFDTVFEWMQPSASPKSSQGYFVKADIAGIEEGAKYLRTIDARGGTEIGGALDCAISEMTSRKKATGRQPVIVILTDGAVGNESYVLKLIQGKLSDIRVFTVGIDTAVNEGFLRRLASLGGGTASFVQPTTAIEAALEQVSREIGTPLIQNLSLEDSGCGVDLDSMAPMVMPDMFEGRAVTAFFQLTQGELKAKAAVKIKGTYPDGTPFSMLVTPTTTDIAALPQLWAEEHITDLEDAYRVAAGDKQKELHDKIVAIAIEHGLLTKFTAFVIVDHSEVVNKDGKIRTILQPVHEAALWEMNQNAATTGSWGVPAQAQAGAWGASPPLAQAMRRQVSAQPMPGAHPSPPQAPRNAPAPSQDYGLAGSQQQQQQPASPAPASWGAPSPLPKQMQSGTNQFQQMQGGTGGTGGMPMSAFDAKAPGGQWENVASEPTRKPDQWLPKVREALEALMQSVDKACEAIKKGALPKASLIESTRLELLERLSKYENASELPNLQKYLRSELIKFIAAVDGANTVNDKLKQLVKIQEQALQKVKDEMQDHANAPAQQPFWHSTV